MPTPILRSDLAYAEAEALCDWLRRQGHDPDDVASIAVVPAERPTYEVVVYVRDQAGDMVVRRDGEVAKRTVTLTPADGDQAPIPRRLLDPHRA